MPSAWPMARRVASSTLTRSIVAASISPTPTATARTRMIASNASRSAGVNSFRETTGNGVLLITHYTRILKYVRPDFVHVFVAGRIVQEGGPELADELEADGYEKFLKAGAAA